MVPSSSVHRIHRVREGDELAEGDEAALQRQVRGAILGGEHQGESVLAVTWFLKMRNI